MLIPTIIDTLEPTHQDKGAILMQCLEGDILENQKCNTQVAYDIGKSLAIIHSNKAPFFGECFDSSLASESIDDYFSHKFYEELNECKDQISHPMIDNCKEFFERNRGLLQNVDGPCYTHGDFRFGNILTANNKLTGIIDWSSARFSFAEMDLCMLNLSDLNFSKEFFKGYASVRSIPIYKEIFPLVQLRKALAIIGYLIRTKKSVSNKTLFNQQMSCLKQFFLKNLS